MKGVKTMQNLIRGDELAGHLNCPTIFISILNGFNAYYVRAPTLLEDIKISRADVMLQIYLKSLKKEQR